MKNPLLLFPILFFLATSSSACSGGGDEPGKETTPAYTVFKGKNLVAFGNSITSDQSNNTSWAYQTRTRLEFGDLYNGAFAGACWYKRERSVTADPVWAPAGVIRTQDYTDPKFAGYSNESNTGTEAFQRIINNCAVVHVQKYLAGNHWVSKSPDVIVLSYGTNDAASATMGVAAEALAESDLAKLDLYTMAGAMKWCLVTLRNKFPGAKIYVAGPLQASLVKYPNKNAENTQKIAVIKAVCEGLSIPYFDCYNESGITSGNADTYLRDGLHPNGAGQTVHANYIVRKLKAANPQ